jgi:molecular chaperone DnaK (HSP70)
MREDTTINSNYLCSKQYKKVNWSELMPEYVLGIDLGTYNSAAAVAYLDENNDVVRLTMVKDEFDSDDTIEDINSNIRKKAFPSFVHYDSQGNVISVGKKAKTDISKYPKNVIWGVKRLLGKTYTEAKNQGEFKRFSYDIDPDPDTGKCWITIGDKKFHPEAVSAEILKKIKTSAEKQLGVTFTSVIISKPAYFDAIPGTPLIQAAKSAGFTSVKIIPEPIAAGIAFDIIVPQISTKVLVFDLGAGTLDVTVGNLIKKGPSYSDLTFQPKKTTGNAQMGGIDMDDRIFRKILKECNLRLEEISNFDQSRLREAAEDGKIRLSSSNETKIYFTLDNGKKYEIKFTISDLEIALRGSDKDIFNDGEIDIIDECRRQVREAIRGAGWIPENIEEVLLIGGPSLIPCILDMLKEVFYSNPKVLDRIDQMTEGKILINPMEAVARGAALSKMTKKMIPHPYGYGFIDNIFKENEIIEIPMELIPRDTTISQAIEKSHTITWFMDKTTTQIEIIQHMPQHEIAGQYEWRSLGHVDIALRNPGLGPIEIKMGLSENEELIITIRQLMTNEEVKYIGISHLKRIPIQLPRIVPKPPDGKKTKGSYSINESVLKELVEWSQGLLRLAKNCQDEIDDKDLRKFTIRLSEALEDHALDNNNKIDIAKAKKGWDTILNRSIELLHFLIEKNKISIDMGINYKQKSKEIENNLQIWKEN